MTGKLSIEDKLKIARIALWIMVDKYTEKVDNELLFGAGITETDIVSACLKEAYLNYNVESRLLAHRPSLKEEIELINKDAERIRKVRKYIQHSDEYPNADPVND